MVHDILKEQAQEVIKNNSQLRYDLAGILGVDERTIRRAASPDHRRHSQLLLKECQQVIKKYMKIDLRESITEEGGIHA